MGENFNLRCRWTVHKREEEGKEKGSEGSERRKRRERGSEGARERAMKEDGGDAKQNVCERPKSAC